jgi:hypothetical protein
MLFVIKNKKVVFLIDYTKTFEPQHLSFQTSLNRIQGETCHFCSFLESQKIVAKEFPLIKSKGLIVHY